MPQACAARHWQTVANALQVRKLYKMLENPQDESVVRWGNEGDSFVVLENEKFTKHILPVRTALGWHRDALRLCRFVPWG